MYVMYVISSYIIQLPSISRTLPGLAEPTAASAFEERAVKAPTPAIPWVVWLRQPLGGRKISMASNRQTTKIPIFFLSSHSCDFFWGGDISETGEMIDGGVVSPECSR